MNNVRIIGAAALFAALPFLTSAAQAAVVPVATNTGPLASPASFTSGVSFSGAQSGLLSFALVGYRSLDGVNFYEDDFSLKLNGTTIFVGSFDLGGGGSNFVNVAPVGATYTVFPVGNGQPTWAGGVATIFLPLSFTSGLNTLEFSYVSLGGPGHAGPQGLGDEGWGVRDASVVTAAVPEPATWAMLTLGFLGLGALSLRRRKGPRAA